MCNASRDVTVSPPPPDNCSCTASITKDRDQADPDQPVAFTGSATVSEGCTATVSGMAWDFGDGATGSGQVSRCRLDGNESGLTLFRRLPPREGAYSGSIDLITIAEDYMITHGAVLGLLGHRP